MVKKKLILSQEGVLHLPLGTILVVWTLAALSMLGILRHWRHLTELQLRLDRCVGKKALVLRDTLTSIEVANDRIKVLRKAMLGPGLHPQIKAGLTTLMNTQVLLQEGLRIRWQGERVSWLARRGCDGKSDLPIPLPAMAWVRGVPDALGPAPLHWQDHASRKLVIRLSHLPRKAAAHVELNSIELNGETDERNKWRAKWAAPEIALGADIH